MAILDFGSAPDDFCVGQIAIAANNHWFTSATYIPSDCPVGAQMGLGDVTLYDGRKLIAPSAAADIWASWSLYAPNFSLYTNAVLFEIRNGSTPIWRCRWTSSDELQMQSYNGSSWSNQGSPSSVVTKSTVNRFDLRINLDGASGNIDLYINGVSEISISGDTIPDATGTWDEFILGNGYAIASTSTAYFLIWSEVFLADEDTRDIKMLEVAVDGNGNYTAWSGDYLDVDNATALGDDSSIYTTASGNRESFTCASLSATYNSGYDVLAVGVKARAVKQPGSDDIQLMVRSGTTDSDSTAISTNTLLDRVTALWANDPNTASAWTYANADSAEVGVYS